MPTSSGKRSSVLVVDSDSSSAYAVQQLLTTSHFYTLTCSSANECLHLLTSYNPSAIITEVALPDVPGDKFLNDIRATGYDGPVIILSSTADLNCRVTLLEAGADDYILKPFDAAELIARLRAALRRLAKTYVIASRHGGLHLDLISGYVEWGQKRLRVNKSEFAVLRLLAENGDRPTTLADIKTHLGELGMDRTLPSCTVLISRVRKSVRHLTNDLGTIRNFREEGYTLSIPTASDYRIHTYNDTGSRKD